MSDSPAPIPQADPRAGYLEHRAAINAAIARVLDSGQYIPKKVADALRTSPNLPLPPNMRAAYEQYVDMRFLQPVVVVPVFLVLFIGFNVYAFTHYDLRHLPSCPRAFFSVNGLLIGTAITSAILLWLDRAKAGRSQNGNDAVEAGTVVGSRVDPLRM